MRGENAEQLSSSRRPRMAGPTPSGSSSGARLSELWAELGLGGIESSSTVAARRGFDTKQSDQTIALGGRRARAPTRDHDETFAFSPGQAFRLATFFVAHGCGSVPDLHRLPLHREVLHPRA